MTYDLDQLGELRDGGTCSCCGAEALGTNGYVFEDPVRHPFAIYMARFTPSHAERSVVLSIGTGDWSEHGVPSSRIGAATRVRWTADRLQLEYTEPQNGILLDPDLVSRVMGPEEAARSPLKAMLLTVSEHIAKHDPRLWQFLSQGEI